MSIESQQIKRIFVWQGKEIEDPAPHLSPDEVRKHLSATRVEMVTANVSMPKTETREGQTVALYTIEKKAGTLG